MFVFLQMSGNYRSSDVIFLSPEVEGSDYRKGVVVSRYLNKVSKSEEVRVSIWGMRQFPDGTSQTLSGQGVSLTVLELCELKKQLSEIRKRTRAEHVKLMTEDFRDLDDEEKQIYKRELEQVLSGEPPGRAPVAEIGVKGTPNKKKKN